MEIVSNLLIIKKFREEKAEIELLKAKQDFVLKEKNYLSERRKLSEFIVECEKKEKAMYVDLCQRVVVQKDIDDVLFKIQEMKIETESLREKVDTAKQKKDEASACLEVAKIAHREAVRMREKFEEIRTIHKQERDIELSRIEDVEMEEAATSKFFQSDASS